MSDVEVRVIRLPHGADLALPSYQSELAAGLDLLAAVPEGSPLVIAPWLLRDLAVFGSPFPSAGGHLLWITDYNEQFSISHDPTVGSYWAWGLGKWWWNHGRNRRFRLL